MCVLSMLPSFFRLFLAIPSSHHYPTPVMPRGKRTVFAGFCPESGNRLATFRFHKQDRAGKAWKDHASKITKYCSVCKKQVKPKLKEERHSA